MIRRTELLRSSRRLRRPSRDLRRKTDASASLRETPAEVKHCRTEDSRRASFWSKASPEFPCEPDNSRRDINAGRSVRRKLRDAGGDERTIFDSRRFLRRASKLRTKASPRAALRTCRNRSALPNFYTDYSDRKAR